MAQTFTENEMKANIFGELIKKNKDVIKLVKDQYCYSVFYFSALFVQRNIAALPYASIGRTTCGKVNDQTSANVRACGNGSYLGGEEDRT